MPGGTDFEHSTQTLGLIEHEEKIRIQAFI
jgi:hypothetical protein